MLVFLYIILILLVHMIPLSSEDLNTIVRVTAVRVDYVLHILLFLPWMFMARFRLCRRSGGGIETRIDTGESLQTARKAENYDLIVFDSPPMIDVTDSILIGKLVDQTILIARSGVSTYESLKQADKMLKSINAKILGMVVNAVDEKKQKYYYYKYYGTYGEGYSDVKARPPA